jgi:hypothetical protein
MLRIEKNDLTLGRVVALTVGLLFRAAYRPLDPLSYPLFSHLSFCTSNS